MIRHCHWCYDKEYCIRERMLNEKENPVTHHDLIDAILDNEGPGYVMNASLSPECNFKKDPERAVTHCRFYEPQTDEDIDNEEERRIRWCKIANDAEEFHRRVSRVSWEDMHRKFTI